MKEKKGSKGQPLLNESPFSSILALLENNLSMVAFAYVLSESGTEASATMMTVIRTALRNGLIPERYLTWLFENSNKFPTERLMPWSDDVLTTRKAFAK